MPKPNTDTPTIYKIEIPQRKIFNKSTGEWELQPLYTTPAWVRYHQKVSIQDGMGQTDDIDVAMEFVDLAGAAVTPDPRPVLQERYAQEMKAKAGTNPLLLGQLANYVRDTNTWRAAHGVEVLSVPVPDVPPLVSILAQPMMQAG